MTRYTFVVEEDVALGRATDRRLFFGEQEHLSDRSTADADQRRRAMDRPFRFERRDVVDLRAIFVANFSVFVEGHRKPWKWYSMAGKGAKSAVLPMIASTLWACVTADSAARSDIETRTAPVSRTLIGFGSTGALIVLAEQNDSGTFYSFELPA